MRSLRPRLSRRARRWRRLAGERPTDPHLFQEWGRLLRPPSDADPVVVERVRDALEGLSQRHQDVLNGLFFEQVTKTTIASRLGVSRHEVRRLMLEAMAALREALS